MFHDRTLSWSFAASVCANLVFVALVGLNALKPLGAFPPVLHICRPFVVKILTAPPPRPRINPLPPKIRPQTPKAVRELVPPRAPQPRATAPPQPSRIQLAQNSTDHTNGLVVPSDGTDPSKIGANAATAPGSGKEDGGQGQGEKITVTTTQTETGVESQAPPVIDEQIVVNTKPRLADRTEPEALTSWKDIASDVVVDASTLSSNEVIVQFQVDATGTTSHFKVLKSCGNSDLDQNAIDGCREMRFKPAIQDGVARTVTFTHEYVVVN